MQPLVESALRFTETYRAHRDAPVPLREARCLEAQFPALLEDLRPADVFAGRMPQNVIVYFGTIWWLAYPEWRHGTPTEGKQGGYCVNFDAVRQFARTDEERAALTSLLDFWESECTVTHVEHLWDDELRRYLTKTADGGAAGAGQIQGRSIGFCSAVDFDRLVRLGLPGLVAEVAARERTVARDGGDPAFLQGLRIALDVVLACCEHYRQQAVTLAAKTADDAVRQRMGGVAETLAAVQERAPQSLREALQLLWIYQILASGRHGEPVRMDVALGDLYAQDLDSGRLSETEAADLLLDFWKTMAEGCGPWVGRIVVGGVGRRNPANADRFALAALEATRRHKDVAPQLTLRVGRGQNPALLETGLRVIGEHGTFPMLYNDDVNIPDVVEGFGVSQATAAHYHPFGCGEFMLATCSPSFVCSVWSVPKSLQAALRDGCAEDGVRIGPATGALTVLDTFEKLYAALRKQVAFAIDLSARFYRYSFDGLPRQCAFLLPSLLTDDCLARGRALLDGGVRYNGASLMGHGWTTVADALAALRQVVYVDHAATLADVVAAMDRNFEGCDALRNRLLAAPKFGNDDDAADGLLVDLWRDANTFAKEACARHNLGFFVLSNVNPGGFGMGKQCGATPDGRKAGESFSIGHAPAAGRDLQGITACLNSVAKVEAAPGGATTNIKFTRDLFASAPAKVHALMTAYFANGGRQANVTVTSQADLEAALANPESFPNLMVRLGGWTARFVTLERAFQEEIVRRTAHGG